MVADDNDVGFRVELTVSTGRDIAHGHKDAAFDSGFLVLPRFADVEEDKVWFWRACD